MIRQLRFLSFLLVASIALSAGRARGVLLLYEPFNYPVGYFLSATPIGAANTIASPIGYLAPNFNNWYGTAIDAGGYQTANDAEVVDYDIYISGLLKPNLNTNALLLGGTGHTNAPVPQLKYDGHSQSNEPQSYGRRRPVGRDEWHAAIDGHRRYGLLFDCAARSVYRRRSIQPAACCSVSISRSVRKRTIRRT